MIKQGKIAFLQIFTVFGTRQRYMNRIVLDGAIKQKASDKKNPATQKKKFSVKDFVSKFNQIHRKMYILSYLLKNLEQRT